MQLLDYQLGLMKISVSVNVRVSHDVEGGKERKKGLTCAEGVEIAARCNVLRALWTRRWCLSDDKDDEDTIIFTANSNTFAAICSYFLIHKTLVLEK